MNTASDVVRVASVGMRDLLHDTALAVTTLASGGSVQNAAPFRERCNQLAEQFEDALTRRGYPEDIKREALIAQCGLLDEMALRHLPTEARNAWELHPVQVERFSIYDAGRRIIDRIEAHVHEASPDIDLLEYYAAILGMGFVGRYAREGEAKRAALIAALNARLDTLRSSAEEPFVTDRTGSRLSGGMVRSVPWIIVALVCVAAVAVWMTGNMALETQFSHIGPEKVARS
ncbi:MAG TPA: DotU family type IV/VI secretion system protein [Paraburkholderia sp.]|uniref:DotU family type IV/VI secretion system protein n=1 Tax=Paraburkholderia sp. TaxID=1926495 RepID=UPI002ED2BD0F